MIEEIGHDREVDAAIALADLQRRRDRQVGFADADATAQVEPAFGSGSRANSARRRRPLRSRDQLEILEGMPREAIEIREAAQRLAPPLRLLGEPALAVEEPAEVRMPNRDFHAHPARILADRTAPRWGRRGRAVAPAGPTGMERDVGRRRSVSYRFPLPRPIRTARAAPGPRSANLPGCAGCSARSACCRRPTPRPRPRSTRPAMSPGPAPDGRR